MSYKPESVISYSSKVLDFIAKKKLSDQEKDWVTSETLEGFKENCNPGFLEYRKAVSNNYAAVEWEDSGTGFTDLQGRKYIDCLAHISQVGPIESAQRLP